MKKGISGNVTAMSYFRKNLILLINVS